MISLNEIFDSYGRKARLFPAFLASSPLLALAATYTPLFEFGVEHLVWVIVVSAALYLLADLARRRGKSVEKSLTAQWGGYPSKLMLRHSDETVDAHTKQRYHNRAEALIEGMNLPSPEEERASPKEADAKYESVVRYLLANTRDSSKFALLLKENTAYGFRRNLYGLKSAGLAMLVGCFCFVAYNSRDVLLTGELPEPPAIYLLIAYLVYGVLWLALVTASSVRDAADEYARQLLTSLEVL